MARNTENYLSITKAQARLKKIGDDVERSALSRYISARKDAIRTMISGRETLVNMDDLISDRATNPRTEMPPRLQSDAISSKPNTKSEASSRKTAAEASLKELELAQKAGQVVSIQEIESIALDAVAALKQAQENNLSQIADKIMTIRPLEPRYIKAAIKDYNAQIAKAFAATLEAYIADALPISNEVLNEPASSH